MSIVTGVIAEACAWQIRNYQIILAIAVRNKLEVRFQKPLTRLQLTPTQLDITRVVKKLIRRFISTS